jgi:NAD(P)-dependent dehydrogenase (short-subunit alcohol dehydrogenase family)
MESISKLVSLKDSRAIITGAASGIGPAIARRFAEAGADLVLVDINQAGLGETVKGLQAFPVDVRGEVVDLTRRGQIESFWQKLAQPCPDILINNAGIYPMKDFLRVDSTHLEKTLRVNFKAPFWMCQEFIHRRWQQGGTIVNVSTIEAILPFKKGMVPYISSKAALIALTRSLAHDYGRKGFRANVIVPGAIKTPGTQSLIKSTVRRLDVGLMKTGYLFQNRLALGRWGSPDEVARVALFLASQLSSYVQGAIIPVDGGFLSS